MLNCIDQILSKASCFLAQNGLADRYAVQPAPCFREGGKEVRRREANAALGADSTASLRRQAQKSLASRSQNLSTPARRSVRTRGGRRGRPGGKFQLVPLRLV